MVSVPLRALLVFWYLFIYGPGSLVYSLPSELGITRVVSTYKQNLWECSECTRRYAAELKKTKASGVLSVLVR